MVQTKNQASSKAKDQFAPVELVMPTSEIKKDKELMQKIQPPKWESFVYLMDKNNQCQKIHQASSKEGEQFYKQKLSDIMNRIVSTIASWELFSDD